MAKKLAVSEESAFSDAQNDHKNSAWFWRGPKTLDSGPFFFDFQVWLMGYPLTISHGDAKNHKEPDHFQLWPAAIIDQGDSMGNLT